jgi:hypothetical protein
MTYKHVINNYFLVIFLPTIALHNTSIAFMMTLGKAGLPFHTSHIAQQHLIIIISSVIVSMILYKFRYPPACMILSQLEEQFMAMFPINLIAFLTMSMSFDLSKFTMNGIPPLLTIKMHCSCVPQDTSTRTRTAYSWSRGYSCCLINSIILGINPAPIIASMGGLLSMEIILRIPITPRCCLKILTSFTSLFKSKNLSIR